MRIAYDHRIFSVQRYGGVSRYFCELAAQLSARDDCEVELLAWAHVNEYLRQSPPPVVRGRYLPELRRTGFLRRAINDRLTRRWTRKHVPDLFHETYYACSRLAPPSSRIVLSVYDMIHEKFPGYATKDDRTARAKACAVQRADHIICISESTKTDLMDVLRVDGSRISVVHLGCTAKQEIPAIGAPAIPYPYLLYVGSRDGYKNFHRLLDAVASVPTLRSGVRLVCFGGGPFRRAEIEAIVARGLNPESVVQISGDDQVLANLYAHGLALVYPSLYEGFGIPPLEAMAALCPVICSNTSSLPEVVGDAAELFEPTDASSIAAAIERVVFSSSRAAQLRARGRERADRFSWDRCARETYAVYRSLV